MVYYYCMFLKLAVKNIVTRKSSIIIVLFIAFAVSLFFAGNSVLDSTEHGIRETFTRSFTGDLIIRPKSRIPLSLFGDETPVTGELTDIPRVIPYGEICDYLASDRNIAGFFPQISGRALMEGGGARIPVAVFGADGTDYANNMSAMKITCGEAFSAGKKGLMVSNKLARQMGAGIGDIVQFTVVDGINTRIRALPVAALYDYSVDNTTLDRIVIADADTVRSLMDITDMSYEIENLDDQVQNLLEADIDSFEDDSFFASAGDTQAVTMEGSAITESQVKTGDSGAWNFIVCRLVDGVSTHSAVRRMNRIFKKNGWPVEATDWREAAGSTAIYLYWMRRILNMGILAILAVGLIIVSNTLVINVLNRTREIGTLRAVGAGSPFISLECMAETCILAAAGSAAGCLLGLFLLYAVNRAGIVFTNPFLVQLFGGERFQVRAGSSALFRSLALMCLISVVGWIYPVRAALRISPVTAMAGEE